MKKLFISHAEKDHVLVSNFVDLLYAIGLQSENMFCSSRCDIGVPIEENIYDYLKNLLDADDVSVVYMLSDNYYASVACLNEMGATWVKQKKYYTFLLPDFEFSNIKGAIDPMRVGIKLEPDSIYLKGQLNNFKNLICDMFQVNISENRWEKERDEFIESLKNVATAIPVNLRNYQCNCIGEQLSPGCDARYNKSCNSILVNFNFKKTKSDMCSIVFFMGKLNLQNYFLNDRVVTFCCRARQDMLDVVVEIEVMQKRNLKYAITVNKEWNTYTIVLKDFGGSKVEWKEVNEFKFLLYRGKVRETYLEIKDIKFY